MTHGVHVKASSHSIFRLVTPGCQPNLLRIVGPQRLSHIIQSVRFRLFYRFLLDGIMLDLTVKKVPRVIKAPPIFEASLRLTAGAMVSNLRSENATAPAQWRTRILERFQCQPWQSLRLGAGMPLAAAQDMSGEKFASVPFRRPPSARRPSVVTSASALRALDN